MSFGAELGYEDRPRRLSDEAAAARVRSWRIAPAAIGWLGGGVVLLVLGVVARRPDVVAIGAPLLIGLAWGTSRRPARVPGVRRYASRAGRTIRVAILRPVSGRNDASAT